MDREIDYYSLGHKRQNREAELEARIKELENENQKLRDRIDYLEDIQHWQPGSCASSIIEE
jgi:uncharacterized protein YceH (UPF0502 family)